MNGSIRRLVSALLPLLLVGCQGLTPTVSKQLSDRLCRESALRTAPGPDTLVWSAEVAEGAAYWRAKASQRWPGRRIVLFCCHGNTLTLADGRQEWWCYPDAPRGPQPVYVVASVLHDLYPDAVVVLITCNPGGVDLHVDGVAYAKRTVWITPNPPGPVSQHRLTGAGSIWDFHYQEPHERAN